MRSPAPTYTAPSHPVHAPADVEVLSRVMRKFDQDGLVVEEVAQLGEIIIKVGAGGEVAKR